MALSPTFSIDDLCKILESIKVEPGRYHCDAQWLDDAKSRFEALPQSGERDRWLALHRAAKEAHDTKKAAA